MQSGELKTQREKALIVKYKSIFNLNYQILRQIYFSLFLNSWKTYNLLLLNVIILSFQENIGYK